MDQGLGELLSLALADSLKLLSEILVQQFEPVDLVLLLELLRPVVKLHDELEEVVEKVSVLPDDLILRRLLSFPHDVKQSLRRQGAVGSVRDTQSEELRSLHRSVEHLKVLEHLSYLDNDLALGVGHLGLQLLQDLVLFLVRRARQAHAA